MPYNYSYQLKENPRLASVSEISFDPVTDIHRARIEHEIKNRRRLSSRGAVGGVISIIIAVLILAGGLYVGLTYPNLRLIIVFAVPFVLFALGLGIFLLMPLSIKVTGIKEAVVADRETHSYYREDAYGHSVETATDRVTLKFSDTDKEVSIVTDPYTQMHCIPGKKVYLLRTTMGHIISFDE